MDLNATMNGYEAAADSPKHMSRKYSSWMKAELIPHLNHPHPLHKAQNKIYAVNAPFEHKLAASLQEELQ